MPTFGTPVLVDANGDKPLAIAKLSSTLSIAAYDDTGTTDLRAVTVTVGATPVVNTSVQVENSIVTSVALVALTSTTAMIVYNDADAIKARILSVSGTTITVNSATTLSDTLNSFDRESVSACFVTSARVMSAYQATTGIRCVILSVSGTTITDNGSALIESGTDHDITNCASFSSTKAFVMYNVSSTVRQWGATITISGTTPTSGTPKIIESITASDESEDTATIQMSATKIIAMACAIGGTDLAYFWVITLNGTTFDIGTRFDLVADNGTGTGNGILSAALITATSFLVVYKEKNVDNLKLSQLDITGGGSDELTETGTAGTLAISSILVAKAAPVDSTTVIIHYAESSSDVVLGSVETTLGLAAMTKPADVDASGTFIYVALLEDGSPILTKISTALNADGTTVFDPGAGDNIGVECGRFNADVVWVCGNFDGTNVVEKSEDAGSSFVVKDDATIGDVRAFVMGPDSDDKILLFDETNGDILETRDDGASWISINAAVTPEVNAIARLGKNVQESVFGNQGAANDSINYSVNSGDDLEDFQSGPYPSANATRVIIN